MDIASLSNDFEKYLLGVFATPSVWLEKGSGMKVWDVNGKEYLDFLGGIAVCATGHCHAKVSSALCAQVQKLMHCSNLYGIPNEVELAKRLCTSTGYDRAFFSNSGAEANEAAIKMARKWAHTIGDDKSTIISASNSFHGRTLVTATATGQPKFQAGYNPLPKGFEYVPYNNISALQDKLDKKTTAAVMLEPIQGEGGVIPASKEYLRSARDICADTNTLLVMDEIQTGMGRTGKFLASEHFGVKPDIATLAKALGSGFPIGATLATENVASAMGPGDHGSTFGGNPMACAAALATLDVMEEEDLMDNALKLGSYLTDRLTVLLKPGAPEALIGSVRGFGLLQGVVLNSPVAVELKNKCAELGLLVGSIGDSVLRLAPPLIATRDDIDAAAEILEDACGKL